jgi:hypothetical protein
MELLVMDISVIVMLSLEFEDSSSHLRAGNLLPQHRGGIVKVADNPSFILEVIVQLLVDLIEQ